MSTLAELDDLVTQELGESASAPVFWTSDDVRLALNEGYEEISDWTEWLERVTPMKLLARRTYYDLRGISTKYPVLTVKEVALQNPVRWLFPTSARDIDGESFGTWGFPQWERIAGRTVDFFMRSPYWLGIRPQPSDDTTTARVSHTSLPARMVRDEDQPRIEVEFERGLVAYALYDLFVQDGETTLAMKFWQEFVEYAQGFAAFVQDRQARDRAYGMKEEETRGPWY